MPSAENFTQSAKSLITINYTRTHISTVSNSQHLLTLASERYTIYFDIERKPGHVCLKNNL